MMFNASGAAACCQIFTELHLNPIHTSPFFSLQEGRAAVSQYSKRAHSEESLLLARLAIEVRAGVPNTEQNSAVVDTFVCFADP